MMLDIIQIPVLSDNYVYLLHDSVQDQTAVVDPAVDAPVNAALAARGWSLDFILNTHHHPDHVGANMALKAAHGCTIVGAKTDANRIPGIDITLGDGDTFTLGGEQAVILDVPGHTCGHIAYYFVDAKALFVGDTLFALGCGRLFEGTPAQMLASLDRLAALAPDTRIYCAHEYTLSNGLFALSVDPGNPALQDRMADIHRLRADGRPTVPSLLGEELATNPFLRADTPELAAGTDMQGSDRLAVFTETRRLKDSFRG